MQYVVRVPSWDPTDHDLSQESEVSAGLRERLEDTESMQGLVLWHNSYLLAVLEDQVTGDTRVLTCRVIDVSGSTRSGWMLNRERRN